MKKNLLYLIISIIVTSAFGQQVLIENTWTLHYMVVDDVTYNITQPDGQLPGYDPGVGFFEDSFGYQMIAGIYGNYYASCYEPIAITSDNFTTYMVCVSLGDCWPYCDLEQLYFGFFGPAPRTFLYEIIDDSNGKTLTIINPEGDIAVHGNYILSNEVFLISTFRIYPNPVMDNLNISNQNSSLESCSIYSISGKKLISDRVQGDKSIDVSKLSAGIYFFEGVSSIGEKTVRRFIKK